MSPKYFDVHTHVQFPAYDVDRADVLRRAMDAGVWMANVGTTIETSKKAIELAEINEGLVAIVGIHPTHAEESHYDAQEYGESEHEHAPSEAFDKKELIILAKHKKTVAIGECGLDYFRMTADTKDKQETLFRSHIELATEVGKPLMLHVRSGKDISAYDDALAILKEYGHPKANFHFFAGSLDEAKRILDAGYMISFSGVITFARSYDAVIKNVPLDRIMIETDAPYVSPVPYRGKRNEPLFIKEVYQKVAAILGEEADMVRQTLVATSKAFFGLN